MKIRNSNVDHIKLLFFPYARIFYVQWIVALQYNSLFAFGKMQRKSKTFDLGSKTEKKIVAFDSCKCDYCKCCLGACVAVLDQGDLWGLEFSLSFATLAGSEWRWRQKKANCDRIDQKTEEYLAENSLH